MAGGGQRGPQHLLHAAGEAEAGPAVVAWGGGGPGGAVAVAVSVAGRGEGVRHGVVVGVEALDPV